MHIITIQKTMAQYHTKEHGVKFQHYDITTMYNGVNCTGVDYKNAVNEWCFWFVCA